MKILKIIPSKNSINANRISSIQFGSGKRYIETAQVGPPCVVGMKNWGESKSAIKLLEKFIFEGFIYQNRVLKYKLIMELKDIRILKERVSTYISS